MPQQPAEGQGLPTDCCSDGKIFPLRTKAVQPTAGYMYVSVLMG